MNDRFFAIRLILRFGTLGAWVISAAFGLSAAVLLWPAMGWMAPLVALLAAGLAFLLCKSYVELVSIVFSMVH
ncbi:hypothetical protein [Azoarcus sp. DN11]|uniref:hypothetical protein n=1 Tax=Azoarcus sp. DN11 TaxID=356837 RepID=UPI000EB472FC|nr:hypothetical protein [Azoarcus sp. DN11]AYH43549.1 hypothetical protein CDA09_09160 [Azoarcus sp. DN11]